MAPSDVEADAAESVYYQAIAFKEGTVLVMLTVMHVGGGRLIGAQPGFPATAVCRICGLQTV